MYHRHMPFNLKGVYGGRIYLKVISLVVAFSFLLYTTTYAWSPIYETPPYLTKSYKTDSHCTEELGISGPATDEMIEISLYTMNRIAGLHGSGGNPARIDYDTLQSVIASPSGSEGEAISHPILTLINQKHYVVITKATDTQVTYFDANIGISGEEVTVSKKEFLDSWQGNVIIPDSFTSSLRVSAEAQ